MAVDARCQGITKQGLPCRAWATRSGFCPIHAPELVGIVAEARRRGGYNRANAKRLRRLLEATGFWEVFKMTMITVARLERGELSPQVAVAASHLLKVALEAVEAAHKLAKAEGAPPQALPSVTAVTQDEERWARVMARATQLYEEATASGAQPQLSEQEEKEARLIAEATRILKEVTPPRLKTAPSALPTEAPERPPVPIAGGRLVVHGRGP
jgi:ribonuclease D